MKGLKKLALATAVAAIPFAAHADLKALDDTSMGNVTGQAGVTIELETKIDIGEFRYTDEGYFAMSGISIGGGAVNRDADGNVISGVSGILDDLKIDIDVEADGDAVIHVGSISGAPIDYAMTVDSMSLNATDGSGHNTTLVSNLGMEGNLAQLDMRVDTEFDQLLIDVGFNVTDMDMDIDFLGVNIRDMAVMGATFFESAGAPSTPTDLFAFANLTIEKGTNAAGADALQISVPSFVADISVGAVEIGGSSIGSFQMDNLAITQTTMKVYGHE